jgi:hypothetical protein
LSNHRTSMTVLGHATLLVATAASAKHWKLHALQAHQALTDVVIGGWVNGATLGITKKLVQSVVRRTLPDLVVVVQLLRLVDGIVNRTVSRVLWWATVEAGRSTSRMLLAVAAVGTKRTIRILISTRCSGKRLQVSDDCRRQLETEREKD